MPAGYTNTSSVDSLGSAEMRDLVGRFREDFDVVLMAAPPALEVPDASTLGPMSDLVLLVGCSGRTRGRALPESLAALEQPRGLPVRVVLHAPGGEPPPGGGGG